MQGKHIIWAQRGAEDKYNSGQARHKAAKALQTKGNWLECKDSQLKPNWAQNN